MGKRKSRSAKSAAPKKKLPKLDKVFTCPFCSHPGSVECRIEPELEIAEASCGICEESYSTTAHSLTEPIDVYAEWIDECELANENPPRRLLRPPAAPELRQRR
ncbi:hypothetical protein EJB05_46073, partial [Eragrostis curvula]